MSKNKKTINSQLSIINSLKPYPEYKDSWVEWIGEIPEHWEVLPIKRIVSTPVTDGPHETPEILLDGIPFISAEAIKNDRIDFSKKRGFISIENHQRYSKKYKPVKGDLFLVKSGATTGNIAIVETDEEFNIWSPLAVIRSNPKKVITRFMFHFLKSKNFFQSIELGWNFGTQQNIGMGIIENLPAIIPPIKEQTKIAAYLDRKTAEIDELIARKQRLLELYEEEKTAIINQAVTKGINPDVKMKDSGIEWLGEIPEHWDVLRLKYGGQFINGYSFKSIDFAESGVRILKISNIQHMRLDWTDSSFTSKKNYEKLSDFQVFRNDLVFALTRPIISTGIKAAMIDTDDNILINQRNSIFRTSKIETNWIYYILLCKQFLNKFYSLIDKTGQQPNISSNDIGNIAVPIPNKKEQKDIVTHLQKETTRINTKAQKTKKLIELLKEYRTALISEVVTGKLIIDN
ncbi:Type I restriction endonuclease domain-containing protein [Desulfonema limicola]|uniref:Type I restriction endonuclease domain-containing protein n=1 Tax=Desulfonema limicola TaxID=45656 RepID=A0A975BBE0_9BACT|nr:restriction endonuclease subunit S [Desulfonema limicola]QTA82267.1 Type I restriction endonuclease domain-containing protein [Desulfonema limicola]